MTDNKRIQQQMSRRISRRKILCSAAATSALAPFVPILESEAQATTTQRLVTWATPNGTIQDQWVPTGGLTDFKLGRILAPLEPHRSKLVITSGLEFTGSGPGTNHQKGHALMFAGSILNDGDFTNGGGRGAGWGTGISVDQAYADKVGDQTPFRSHVVGVQLRRSTVWERMSYLGDNQPVTPDLDPAELFDRVFGTFQATPEEGVDLRAQKQSVLDLVSGELERLSPKYGVADKIKVEGHLEAIRAIERRLSTSGGGGSSCTVVSPGADVDLESDGSHPEIGKRFSDILALSFACDTSRVGSVMWGGSTSMQTFPWLSISDRHHPMSHDDQNPGTIEELIEVNTWYSEQLAYFMDKLAEIPEGNGTALDNTLILSGNELGQGSVHSHTNVPILLAGGAGGKLEMGRHIPTSGEANNRLLVSVLELLGVEGISTFGTADQGSGPLKGLV